jgi:hypothetical protein
MDIFSDVESPYSDNSSSLLQQNGDQNISINTLAVGAGNVAMYTNNQGLWLGSSNFASAQSGGKFAVDMNGNLSTSGANLTNLNASNITTGTLSAARIAVGSLNGNLITSNTITATQIQANTITAAQIAANTITATQIAASVISGGKIVASLLTASNIQTGTLDASLVNVTNLNASNITTGSLSGSFISGGDGNIDHLVINTGLRIGTAQSVTGISFQGVFHGTVNNQLVMDNDLGMNNHNINGTNTYFFNDGTKITSSGSNKTAVIPTSKGYREIYCIESPEVWIMDFCCDNNISQCNPLFIEITEGEAHFIRCTDSMYQVWRRRKGHEDLRFREVSKEDFISNEKFYGMARI